jgi:hypothetical protein
MYKNIVLKSEMGSISTKAASIEENVAVPASKFAIPDGYTVQEVNVAEETEKATNGGSGD